MTDTTSPKLGKIFIGGLSYETTDEKLRSYFGAYGAVTDAVVMKDPISRRSRGFGFITYSDPACVDRALAQPNHVLDSRRVEAKRAVPRAESSRESSAVASSSMSSAVANSNTGIGIPTSSSSCVGQASSSMTSSRTAASGSSSVSNAIASKKIFVGGLHYETKDADFKNYFEEFGTVVSAEVMFNRETNKSRGFGFVVFEAENSVDLVLEDRNHTIDGKSVEVKRAVPRTDAPPSRNAVPKTSASGPSSTVAVGSAGRTRSASSTTGTTSNSTKSEETPRSFAAVTNGTLGGYAAAVRYGGRVPPPSTSAESSPSNKFTDKSDRKLSDAYHNLSVEDSNSNDARHNLYHADANRSPSSNSGNSLLNKSPSLDPSIPNLSIGGGGLQWSGYSPLGSQYGTSKSADGGDHEDQSGAFSSQWNQPSQWQQWPQHGLGQTSPATEDNSQNSSPGSSKQSFFSMFGSSMPDAKADANHAPSSSTANGSYLNSTWDSGYGSGLGMGNMMGSGIGMGMGIGLGMDSNLMQGATGPSSLGDHEDSSMSYGSNFGGLQQPNFRQQNSLDGIGMGFGSINLAGTEGNLDSENASSQQSTEIQDQDKRQQQSHSNIGSDYGSSQRNFQGYR